MTKTILNCELELEQNWNESIYSKHRAKKYTTDIAINHIFPFIDHYLAAVSAS